MTAADMLSFSTHRETRIIKSNLIGTFTIYFEKNIHEINQMYMIKCFYNCLKSYILWIDIFAIKSNLSTWIENIENPERKQE